MKVDLIVRTVIAMSWLACLAAHAGPDVTTAVLALAVLLVWAAPLMRRRLPAAAVPR